MVEKPCHDQDSESHLLKYTVEEHYPPTIGIFESEALTIPIWIFRGHRLMSVALQPGHCGVIFSRIVKIQYDKIVSARWGTRATGYMLRKFEMIFRPRHSYHNPIVTCMLTK